MNRILFVVVIYKCRLLETKTYKTLLAKETDAYLYVYDNSPYCQNIGLNNIVYIHNPQNEGLSVAYNSAAKYALANGFDWMLLLDQDTDFSELTIRDYQKAISQNPTCKLFAPKVKSGDKYMSPVNVRHKFARLCSSPPIGNIELNKFGLINSGMCVNVEAMIACGGYKEDVFLDYSDYQFLDRFKRLYPYAYVIDYEVMQDFSVYSDDKNSTLKRYELFCKSIKACERYSLSDNFWYFFVVIKRGLSICLRFMTLEPIKIFWSRYC